MLVCGCSSYCYAIGRLSGETPFLWGDTITPPSPRYWQCSGCRPLHPCIVDPGEESPLSLSRRLLLFSLPLALPLPDQLPWGRGLSLPPLVSRGVVHVCVLPGGRAPALWHDIAGLSAFFSSAGWSRRQGGNQRGRHGLLSSLDERACLATDPLSSLTEANRRQGHSHVRGRPFSNLLRLSALDEAKARYRPAQEVLFAMALGTGSGRTTPTAHLSSGSAEGSRGAHGAGAGVRQDAAGRARRAILCVDGTNTPTSGYRRSVP